MVLATYPAGTIGWAAAATGAAGLVALLSAMLFPAYGRTFGTINDLGTGIGAIASVALAMLVFPEHYLQDAQMGLAALALAVAGGALGAFGSLLSLFGVTSWFLAGLYVAAGNALTGGWLIVVSRTGWGQTEVQDVVLQAGLITGAAMALGAAAIPGIMSRAESEQSAPWISRRLGKAGDLGARLMFPIWCLWLGRVLLVQ